LDNLQEALNGSWLLQRKGSVFDFVTNLVSEYMFIVTNSLELSQVANRLDKERKSFARMFQSSGKSDENNKVIFKYHFIVIELLL
jgi:hypothetical protein